jgi:Fe-S cluster biogenesis protein NfuA/nitrite reductase/ring-hydroxylating ferredoxin subunit
MGWTDEQARERVARLEAVLEELERLPEPAGATAMAAVAGLVDVYGEALARILGGLSAEAAQALAADELVGHLLMVHDLSPQSLEARVTAALDEVRPYLASHGGGVELVGVERGTVRLRLEGHCNGCPSSTATLKLAVEDAIRTAAPEVERIEADGAVEEPPAGALPMAAGPALPVADAVPAASAGGASLPVADVVPAPSAGGASLPVANGGSLPIAHVPARPAGWSVVGTLPDLTAGGTLLRDVAGEELLFARPHGGGLYAYRPACPGCGGRLAGSPLEGAELVCAGCGRRYDVAAAGRCTDDPGLHLEPVPLLVGESGGIRVAHRERVAT